MTKFFKKSKNVFFLENGVCQFLNISINYHQAKYLEKLMTHSRDKCQTDGPAGRGTKRQR